MVAACKTVALMHAILEYTLVAIRGEFAFSTTAGSGWGQAGSPGTLGCLRPAFLLAPSLLA
jgi:hypothetical protein